MISNNTGACSSKSPPGFLLYSFLNNAGYTVTLLSYQLPLLLVKGHHKVHGAQLLVCNNRIVIVLY